MKKFRRVSALLMLAATIFFASAIAPAQSRPNSGWYTTAQAASGAKAYQKTCASCHGAKLQGGMGPALIGRQF